MKLLQKVRQHVFIKQRVR